MATPESLVKRHVKALLDKYEAFHTWPVPSGYGESLLDCVGHSKGRYFEIETKAPGQHPTPRQQYRIDRIVAAGGKIFVIGESVENDPDTWSGMLELELWLKQS
jgi:hypothetical protein